METTEPGTQGTPITLDWIIRFLEVYNINKSSQELAIDNVIMRLKLINAKEKRENEKINR